MLSFQFSIQLLRTEHEARIAFKFPLTIRSRLFCKGHLIASCVTRGKIQLQIQIQQIWIFDWNALYWQKNVDTYQHTNMCFLNFPVQIDSNNVHSEKTTRFWSATLGSWAHSVLRALARFTHWCLVRRAGMFILKGVQWNWVHDAPGKACLNGPRVVLLR